MMSHGLWLWIPSLTLRTTTDFACVAEFAGSPYEDNMMGGSDRFPCPQAWLNSGLETDSSSCCLWFNLKPQGPEAHGFDSVSFSG